MRAQSAAAPAASRAEIRSTAPSPAVRLVLVPVTAVVVHRCAALDLSSRGRTVAVGPPRARWCELPVTGPAGAEGCTMASQPLVPR